MKTVYLLRHGESESNVSGAPYLGKEAKLTAKGIRDTESILPALKRLDFDTLVSSSSPRALATAEIIASSWFLPVEVTDLFVEREHPSELLGISHEDNYFQEIKQKEREQFKKGETFSDEESFSVLYERAEKFRDFLLNIKSKNILAVGHGKFTKFFLAFLCFGKNLSPDTYTEFEKFTVSRNLGMSEVTYDENKDKWTLRQWNARL